MMPPTIQHNAIAPTLPVSAATARGTRKMPLPMIMLTSTASALRPPSCRTSCGISALHGALGHHASDRAHFGVNRRQTIDLIRSQLNFLR
jgi:hypothetical protein